MKRTRILNPVRRTMACIAMLLGLTLTCGTLRAAPSQTDVFIKSVQDNMDSAQSFDYRPVLLVAAGGGMIVLLMMISKRRQNTRTRPQALNSPARLIKEMLRDVPLNAAELKQLKLMAASVQAPDDEPTNPLVLLLCPSVMAKGLHRAGNKVDRKTVALIVRKLREGK